MAPNVAITLEGPSIGVKVTTQTDSMGAFSFSELVDGSYNVTIDDTDPDLPQMWPTGSRARPF